MSSPQQLAQNMDLYLSEYILSGNFSIGLEIFYDYVRL